MKNFTKQFTNKTLFNPTRWILLAFMLLLGTSRAWAAVTFASGDYLYFENNSGFPGVGDNWILSNSYAYVHMWGGTGGTQDYLLELYEGTAGSIGAIYRTKTPVNPGTYTSIIFTRNSKIQGPWDNKWNQTSDLTLTGNYAYKNSSNEWDFKNYNPCITPDAPSIEINDGSSAKLCSGTATITTTEVVGATAYKLYKDDSKTASQTNEIGTFTVSEAGTYYVTVTTCDESPKQTTGVKLEYYSTPTLNNKYSKTNSTACGSTPHNNGTVTITPAADVTYTLTSGNITYNKVDNTWSNLSPGDYILTATSTYCAELSVTERIEISEVDKTPTLNDISIKGSNSVCQGGDLTLQLNGNAQDGVTYTWYKDSKESEPVGNGSSLNLSNIQNDATYILVASKTSAEGCPASKETSKEITVNPLPTAPALTSPAPVCEGTKVNLPTEGLKWYDAETGGTEVQNTAITVTGTYWAAAVQSGCESATRTRYDVTVNPKPSIGSISQNVTYPVPFEDVVLTAEDTDAKTINWSITSGDGELSENTGTSVVLTSSTAGTVTVTATATSEADCTFATTKTVTFSAENCTPIVSNDIQIKFYHPSAKSTDDAKKGQWWGMGTLYYSTNNSTWSSIDMGSETSGTHTETISNISKSTLYVYFQSYWTYSHDSKAKSNTLTLERGKKYDIKITRHGDNNINATATATETGSLTKNPDIKTPAVKMVSAEYDEVNDKIVAKGAVYKTGCGVTFWGFQYSTDGQTWGTADTDFIRPNTDNSLSVPGEFEYSFAIPKAGGGDIYYIRAYALNNYNGSYALSNAVYSATSLPVEIPSKTIESATISLVDSEGATEVCPQSTVYLKVSYVGGDFKDYEAADNFPGTDLELVNHDKAKNEAIFSYTATSTGFAKITISNDNTTITTTNAVNITLKNVAPVNAPMISISQATICAGENGSATITVNNPIPGLTYTLYKETKQIGNSINHQTGDLTFDNVTEAGSYTVRAEESVCNNYANSMAVDLKVVTSDVKIGLAVDKTTVNPWQPLKLTVTAPEGYAYTIVGLERLVYTQSGNVYTVKIPRPTDSGWPIKGNSGKPVKTKDVTFEAKIQVTDDLTCGSSSITVKLEDTEENCK